MKQLFAGLFTGILLGTVLCKIIKYETFQNKLNKIRKYDSDFEKADNPNNSTWVVW